MRKLWLAGLIFCTGCASAPLQQTIGDCGRALTFYNQTLALQSAHENAWLGRTVCLTDLKRTEEAIDAATRK